MAEGKKVAVYLFFIIFFILFMAMFTILFIFFHLSGWYNEEILLTAPGTFAIEWFFVIWMIPVVAVVIGYLSVFFPTKIFLSSYIKRISKKSAVGLVSIENLSPIMLWLKLMIRSIILACFTMNISMILSSQQFIIDLIRTDPPSSPFAFLNPDAFTFFALLYIILIPCTFILVPIWICNDVGLIRAKKIRKKNAMEVNLVTAPIYKGIKGYVGIGFILNLIFLIINVFNISSFDLFGGMIFLISPLIIIFCVSPLVLLLDLKQKQIKSRIVKILNKTNLDKEIEINVNLKSLKSI